MKSFTNSLRRSLVLRAGSLIMLFPSLVLLPTQLQANPENGVVVAGMAEIGEGLDGHLAISQSSNRAIINWESFSIAHGELTQFLQPGADSALLNRVIADNPSAIHGALQANGKIFLINPAGIMVGPTGAIDVNGFVASTLDVPDASFMAGGDMIFSGASENGVSNFGRINAVGGDVFLIGKSVVNAGSISAREGTVGLAAGSEVLITAQANAGGERVFVRPGAGAGGGTGIDNSGSIEGAAVELKAHGNMYAMAINNSGSIRATGSSTGAGGKVFLTAAGGRIDNSGSIRASLPSGAGGSIFVNAGKGGLVNAGGEINADGVGSGTKGGNVVVLGEEIAVLSGASISANGDAGGGTIVIGGGANPHSDGEEQGEGGNVESSKITVAAGSSISANGANGPGGIVVIAGSDTSTVSVGGSVSATGGGGSDGGAIFLGGGDVTTTETSVIDASGGINGGTITIQGETSATVNGAVRAVGNSGNGGVILIEGGDQASVGPNAVIDASGGTNGGIITVDSPNGTTDFNGTALATGGTGDGGIITVTGAEGVTVGNSGVLDASGGTNGGIINVTSENGSATFNGTALATGGSGDGGQITVSGAEGVTVGNGALLDASGGANGGVIVVDGIDGVTNFNGTARATGGSGVGGRIDITGASVVAGGTALIDASGATGGGQINVGGGFQGKDTSITNAQNTTVGNGAQLLADATGSGLGGQVVVWADNDTLFSGMISAQGISGGGLVEVSGRERLGFDGYVSTMAANGSAGILLLDPTDGTVSTGTQNLAGNPFIINSTTLGTSLASNNVVISTPAANADRGTITFNNTVTWNSGNSLSVLAHGDLIFNASVQNSGAGAFNAVAGWDGVTGLPVASPLQNPGTVTIADFLNNSASYGNSQNGVNGSIYVGSAAAVAGVAIGSRNGQTNLLAHDLVIQASNTTTADRYAMVGFRDVSTVLPISGSIDVQLNNTLSMTAGNAAVRNMAQIGHGGADGTTTTGVGNITGGIRVAAENGITMTAGTGSTQNYAQIGHGGYQSGGTAGASHTGDVEVSANSGSIIANGGASTDNYVQIGHGGRTARGDHSGTINVSALGDIAFASGNGAQAYALIGHGGYDADTPNPTYYPDNDPLNALRGPTAAERIGNVGSINVTSSSGDVLFTTGSGTNSFVQIGHGGTVTDGDHVGDITVNAKDLRFDASNAVGTAHYAQLGHGGYLASGGHTGDVLVNATGAIAFTAGATTGSYTQIGHGGYNDHRLTRGGSSPNFVQNNNNDRYYPGTHSGSITVSAGSDVSFTAGTGAGTFGQVGHGGFRNAALAGEGHSGDISLIGGGLVSFTAQTGAQAYVQVGHGGYEAFGNHGYQMVRTEGGLDAASQIGATFLANTALAPGSVYITVDPMSVGAGTARFADDGFGKLIDPADALGLGVNAVIGSVNYATGEVIFTANANAAGDPVEVAYLHGGSDILVDGGDGVAFTAGTNSNAYAQIGNGGFESAFATNRNIRPEEVAPAANTSTTTYHLNTPSTTPVGTSGNITVRAGTGTTTNPNAALSFTGGAGSDAYAQIGNGGRLARGDHRGSIDVNASGDIAFDAFTGGATAVTQTSATLNTIAVNGTGTFTVNQTGNLDLGSFVITYDNPLPGFSGTITGDGLGRLFDGATQVGTISTGGVITFTVAVSSGTPNASVAFEHLNVGLRGYVQIGNGGHDSDNPNATTPGDPGNLGNISVISDNGAIGFTAGSRTESYAQIGHGGYASNGDHSGHIVVEALGSGGGISFTAGSRGNAYTQIGHGGTSAKGDFGRIDVDNLDGDNDPLTGADGNITVRSSGSIEFTSGTDTQTYSQIGHGGYDSDTTTGAGIAGSQGEIVVRSMTGDIIFDASAGSGINSYTQIGHGGMASSGDYSGTITVQALGGALAFSAGQGNDSYAQIGHGGNVARGDSTGEIDVFAAGDISFTAASAGIASQSQASTTLDAMATSGTGTFTLAQIANLDRGSSFVITYLNPVAGLSGTITGDGLGNLYDGATLVGTVSTVGVVAFNQVISTTKPTVTVSYQHFNTGQRAYVQVGHGGYDSDNPNNTTTPGNPGNMGNISVVSGNGAIGFTGGSRSASYSQIGHGGYATNGDHSGNIVVEALGAGGAVNFAAGSGVNAYTQIGHGGTTAKGDHGLADVDGDTVADGRISVRSNGAVNFTAGSNSQTYAQIGHGGYDADSTTAVGVPSSSGDILVESTAGDVVFNAAGTAGLSSYVQIGHGGMITSGDYSGAITVRANDGSVMFTGGEVLDRYAQLGHGGRQARGSQQGDIEVLGADGVYFTGGGVAAVTGEVRSVLNDAASGVAASGTLANVANLDRSSLVITVADPTDPKYATITSTSAGVLLDGLGDPVGTLSTAGVVVFTAVVSNPGAGGVSVAYNHANYSRGYAQLGNGGWDADPTGATQGVTGQRGDIKVASTAGDIVFTAGLGDANYAQLGNGGFSTSGDHSGEIVVRAAGDVILTGGMTATTATGTLVSRTTNYAQIGHGGNAALGNHSGGVTVSAGSNGAFSDASSSALNFVGDPTGGLNFTGGTATDTYVQLGHGGRTARGDHSGDITVDTIGDIAFNGGAGAQAYAQLGHGGYDADNPNPSTSTLLMPDGNLYSFGGYGIGGPTAGERLGNSGKITVTSTDGNLTFLSGGAADSYTQLGHGGGINDGDQIGDITVRVDADASTGGVGGNITFDARGGDLGATHYSQLGHGGYFASGGHTGVIDIQGGGVMSFNAGRDSSYAQIGHGGRNDHRLNLVGVTSTTSFDQDTDSNYATDGVSNQSPPNDRRDNANDRYYPGTHSGDIMVRMLGNIAFNGYSNDAANAGGIGYAQIGHGGYRNAADPTSANGQGHNGEITVLAGGLTFDGNGAITAAINPNATITFESGMQSSSYAQVGHGGFEAFGNHSGDINVAAASGIDFHARGGSETFTDNRAGQYSYVQIGHGGINADFDPYLPRALETTSASIGNTFGELGALNVYYANAVGTGTHLAGTIAGFDLDMDGLDDLTGHGSFMPLTTFNQTFVDPSTIRFVDHDNDPLTPMIPFVPTNRGQWFHINAPGAPMDLAGNPVLGNSGDISVRTLAGDVDLMGATSSSLRSREAYVQVGHGGLYTGGDHNGDISIVAQNGNVNLLAGQASTNEQGWYSYAQIGHGGSWSGGTLSGDIEVRALGAGNRVIGMAGADNQAYVQIGHGGYDASYLHGAGTQLTTFDANGVTQSDSRPISGTTLQGNNLLYWYNPGYIGRTEYAQPIGNNILSHGVSAEFRRTITGNIDVEAGDGIFISSTDKGSAAGDIAPSAYSQIGHGGRSTESDNTGNITLNAGTGAVTFTAGNSNQSYTQLGNGG